MRRHILDVRLFKEPDSAGDGEGDIAAGELELQLKGVEVRAVKHRHLTEVGPAVSKLERALSHERRLFSGIAAHDQRRPRA